MVRVEIYWKIRFSWIVFGKKRICGKIVPCFFCNLWYTVNRTKNIHCDLRHEIVCFVAFIFFLLWIFAESGSRMMQIWKCTQKSSFQETLQVTSGNDASGNFCAHDINSLHELCYIFTKIKLPTEKSLKYVAMSLKFASHPNSELFSQTK